ncbi:cyclin-dependent kinase 10 [Gonapodya prolifera JEL478]|uniref:Cyclin-dependent kinase 10 n=1 Tax=Gonapodya prolifera (strain JEL478) TaxID=1344416 RepID=A0A139ABA8_GONPJ|nr:cyclin-dependent kinase 10 [Gonapodya prolifera JEL478]|eukprot:KXS13683.1 cyclin-dependent kinase 10 [Gonapodya prolifera JEL478]
MELKSVNGKVSHFNEGFLGSCRSVDSYDKLNRLGEGTYGIVYRAQNKATGEIVALKMIRMESETDGLPLSSLREVSILKTLQHRNIVNVRDVVVGAKLSSIFMEMEYCEQDMANLMDNVPTPYTQSQVKCLLRQLLEGVAYLHAQYITHRDLKLSNLLLTSEGIMKIADFGLARKWGQPIRPMTPKVVTLWYRAPELLLGDKIYTTAVDMWSVGCIFGELLQHRPLLPGKDEISQVRLISELIGTPTDRVWDGYSRLPLAGSFKFPIDSKPTLRSQFSTISPAALNLLSSMLTYDPKRRISAADALHHEYFRENPRECHPSMIPSHPEIRNQKSEQSRLRHQQEEDEKKAKREREDEMVDSRRKQARIF